MDTYDLAVIGSGPGGYVAAIRAAQLGLKTCLIEKDQTLGGTCLNVGCIPSKALLESSELFAATRDELAQHGVGVGAPALDLPTMMQRKDRIVSELTGGVAQLMKKNKVDVLHGRGRLLAADRVSVEGEGGTQELQARHVLLATGSISVELPFLRYDGQRVVDSTGALAFEHVPEHLIVVGAGAVGLELGSVWRRLGARVTVVEMMPQIVPAADGQLAKTLQRSLKQQGLDIRLKTRVMAADVDDGGVTLTLQDAKERSEQLHGDRILVAVGRRPNSADLGLDAAGVALDDKGRVAVDEHLRTSVGTIYAIGDLVRGPMLAHKAEDEGIAAAETIAGRPGHVNYAAIPGVVYTHPELAWVGLTEVDAKEQGIDYRVGRFLFRANGRAKSLAQEEGMVKILARADDDRLLGVHIVGPRASDLIPEGVLALELGASAEDLARTVHAHPTLAETIKEAALAVGGRAIHA